MSNSIPSIADQNLPTEVTALAAKLAKEFKIDEAGNINLGKDVFATTLPEGLTIETVRKVQDHRQQVASAAAIALMEVGAADLKKHKERDTVSLQFPFEKDRLEMTFDRTREYPGRGEGAEKIVKHGVLTPSFIANGAVGSRGSLKKIKDFSNAYTAAVLGV